MKPHKLKKFKEWEVARRELIDKLWSIPEWVECMKELQKSHSSIALQEDIKGEKNEG